MFYNSLKRLGDALATPSIQLPNQFILLTSDQQVCISITFDFGVIELFDSCNNTFKAAVLFKKYLKIYWFCYSSLKSVMLVFFSFVLFFQIVKTLQRDIQSAKLLLRLTHFYIFFCYRTKHRILVLFSLMRFDLTII